MEPIIIASLIGATATVTTSLIVHRQTKKHAKSKLDQIEGAYKARGSGENDVFATFMPYAFNRLEKYISIAEDGTGSQRQVWNGLTANQQFDNLCVPISFSVDHSDAEIYNFSIKESSASPFSVELVEYPARQEKDKNVFSGHVKIHGSIVPNVNAVSFEGSHEFKNAYLMSRNDVEATYKDSDWIYEYAGFIVNVSSESLFICIEFPPTFKKLNPQPRPYAFIGLSGHVVNQRETKRIQNSFSYDKNKASLEIDKPIFGHRYVISWMPPRERDKVLKAKKSGKR